MADTQLPLIPVAGPVCPHCHLPAVLPDICTPEINAVIEDGIGRSGQLYEAGYRAGQLAGLLRSVASLHGKELRRRTA